MAAPAPLLGIDPKLYRHFAAVTLLISISVAMFASGEAEGDARKASAKAPAPQPTVTLTDKRKSTPPPPPAENLDESDFIIGDDPEGGEIPDALPGSSQQPAGIQIEIDPQARARMSPQQQDAALKALEAERKRREAQGPYRPSPLELQRLRNASALRSGSNGED